METRLDGYQVFVRKLVDIFLKRPGFESMAFYP